MLEKLAKNSQKAIGDGIYEIDHKLAKSDKNIISEIKTNVHASLITEVKFSSPSLGSIRQISDPIDIARSMVRGGAVGLSDVTQAYLINGSETDLSQIRGKMKVT